MNFTPYWHLAWKEYRAVRLFWLAIIGLTVVGYFVVTSLAIEPPVRTAWIFNLALVAPVLFALGCAAAAFSGEQEEGTFEFLRAAPISSRQVLASKLCLTAIGTVVMFILLWPAAQWFNHSQLPEEAQLHNLLGLWLVAALEAIAWGTLFSLLTARPLLAVVLAMAAASTAAHVLAWRMRLVQNFGFEFASYLRAVPWRILAATVVLGIDVYLGLHWLDGTRSAAKPVRVFARRKLRFGSRESAAVNPSIQQLAIPQDRGAMFGHLLWHHWRQSGRLMFIFAVLQMALFEVIGGFIGSLLGDRLRNADFAAIGPLVAFAALMGACVFLPDQERRNYRFFVEHNVLPRYVWLTRQLPWIATLLVATIFTCWRLLKHSDFEYLWSAVRSMIDRDQIGRHADPYARFQYGVYYLPPLAVYLSCIAVSYAAGQWASMMIRSGIMAGFCSLLLSGALCGWVLLMQLMGSSWLWTVAPIPLVLLWATWLRAPDWVRENKTWKARGRAAAAILVPSSIMFIALPIYRVQQIHEVSPGFDVSQFEADVANNAAALATGDLYYQADKLLVLPKEELDDSRPFTPQQREYLEKNARPLALLLEASRRPSLALRDPQTYVPTFLLTLSAHELEADGKLDEALDRYLDEAQALIHMAEAGREAMALSSFRYIFQEITQWAALEGQTPERIRAAIAKLQDLSAADSKFENAVKYEYLTQRSWMSGETSADQVNLGDTQRYSLATAATIDTFMPWERWRALRALNLVTANALTAIQNLQLHLERQVGSPPTAGAVVQAIKPTQGAAAEWWIENPSDNIAALENTFPSPNGMDDFAATTARGLVEFEALRRGTMIVLALQAYRMEHGELPDSLDRLVGIQYKSAYAAASPFARLTAPPSAEGAFFQYVPLDPFSGEEFRYFPHGVPDLPKQPDVLTPSDAPADGIDNSLANTADEWRRNSIVAGIPGIWSTGPDLLGRQIEEQTYDPKTMELKKSTPHLYYWLRWPGYGLNTLPNYEAWPKGIWFPIPAQQK